MKVFATCFLLALVSEFLEHSSGALPNVGSCTYREYSKKFRVCETAFYVNMRRDPNGQCSQKLVAFRDCLVGSIKWCYFGSESLLRSTANSIITEEKFCKDAGISDPYLHPRKHRIPCSSIYFQKAYSCYNETLVLWRTNKADSRLCSVSSEANKCEKTLIDAQCNYTGVTKELIELNFDGYNPFCASLQTPTPTHGVPVQSSTPTHGVPVHSPTTTSRVALPKVGNCTYREYNNKVRVCTKAFFVNMRSDPKGQCSQKLVAFRDCLVGSIKRCYFASKSLIRNRVNSLITEERFCHNAGISDPDLHPQKHRVPCSSIYFQKAYGCYDVTLRLWQRNKADSRLCGVFTEAIKCEKALIDAQCRYTGVNKELMELNFDGYNPFCAPFHNTGSRNQVHDGLMLILSLLPLIAAQYSV